MEFIWFKEWDGDQVVLGGEGRESSFPPKRLTDCSNIISWKVHPFCIGLKCYFYHIINFQRDLGLFQNFLFCLLIWRGVLFFYLPFYFSLLLWVSLSWCQSISMIKPENNLISMKWESKEIHGLGQFHRGHVYYLYPIREKASLITKGIQSPLQSSSCPFTTSSLVTFHPLLPSPFA